ncbi:MAG: hypothetical protein QF473_31440, partial [Planctomycetota bacterium]|nr:hypothetical protein [Planctomycetota bacterium]
MPSATVDGNRYSSGFAIVRGRLRTMDRHTPPGETFAVRCLSNDTKMNRPLLDTNNCCAMI